MAREGRSILAIIIRNFIKSITPRQISGNLMGTDYFGNKYYEIPANPGRGKRKPSRWFEPKEKDDFDQEMPAEWESWLRGRRENPPLEEEIMKNVEIMQMKKKNALELEKQYATSKPVGLVEKQKHGRDSFPQYPEYEAVPRRQKDKEIN